MVFSFMGQFDTAISYYQKSLILDTKNSNEKEILQIGFGELQILFQSETPNLVF